MIRATLLALALAGPALAGDGTGDERPPYQFLEGIGFCLLGEGRVDKTTEFLFLYDWTMEANPEMGLVNLQPGVGEATYAFMSDAVDFCQVESAVVGTDEAAGLFELFLSTGATGLSVAETGTDSAGCTLLTLSNGTLVILNSGGNDPVCAADATAALLFVFPA